MVSIGIPIIDLWVVFMDHKKIIHNVLFSIATKDPEKAFALAVARLKERYPEEWVTPYDKPEISSIKFADIRLSREDAIEIASMVVTFDDYPKPCDDEAYQKALPLLRKFYPYYFEETAMKHTSELREICVLDRCVVCGLCDQPEFQDVFSYDEAGKLTVQHGGVIDVSKNPKLLELVELCPVKALRIGEIHVLNQEEKSAMLDQFNQLVNKELRDYSFHFPYYDYRYEVETYQALPVPAKYRSETKYLTEQMAEDAGLAEFKRAVYSQYENIVKQYLTGYNVKVLRQICTDNADSYYARINSEVSTFLEKAYHLAKGLVGDGFSIPESFCTFDIKPEWDECNFFREKLQNLGKEGMDLQRSGSYYVADYYRLYIYTGGDFKDCYYDFTEAEAQLRRDIDFAISDMMDGYVEEDIKFIVNTYTKKAQAELTRRLAQLQEEVKKSVKVDSETGMELNKKISDLCSEISVTVTPAVGVPWFSDFDNQYNDSCRFFSLGSCEKTAENRRERAYNDCLHFLENLPSSFDEIWIAILSKLLTEWKRNILSAYDACGLQYPNDEMVISNGALNTSISLRNHDDVSEVKDRAVFDYVKENLVSQACYGSIGGVSYISEYSCEITTNYDCDFKETLFGGFKEVNKRYGYFFRIDDFRLSAYEVSKACSEAINSSDFLKKHFSDIKSQVIAEIHRITGV